MTQPSVSAGGGYAADPAGAPAAPARALDGAVESAAASPKLAGTAASREAAVRLRLADLAGPDPAEDREFFAELWACFADHVPATMRELDAALRCSGAEEVQSLAHGLKGSAANLGGDDLAACLATLELQARSGRLADTGDAFERVRQEFDALTRAYAVVLSELPHDA